MGSGFVGGDPDAMADLGSDLRRQAEAVGGVGPAYAFACGRGSDGAGPGAAAAELATSAAVWRDALRALAGQVDALGQVLVAGAEDLRAAGGR